MSLITPMASTKTRKLVKYALLVALLLIIGLSTASCGLIPSGSSGSYSQPTSSPVATTAPLSEDQVRYILADSQLGGVINYYRQFLNQPAVAEAVRRWDSGARVTNINQFERKIVGDKGWQVVYRGTNGLINGMDVILSTDPQAALPAATLPPTVQPTIRVVAPTVPAATESPMRLWLDSVNGCKVQVNGVLNNVQGPWIWNWGDGVQTNGWFPQEHTYSKSGTYSVRVSSSSGIANTLAVNVSCSSNVAPPSYDEAQVRYILADSQLGGVISYYRQFLNQPAVAEAVRRWDAGVRVSNLSQFERKIVGDKGWQVVYRGTNTLINGADVKLSTDK